MCSYLVMASNRHGGCQSYHDESKGLAWNSGHSCQILLSGMFGINNKRPAMICGGWPFLAHSEESFTGATRAVSYVEDAPLAQCS
jgi:hypothetical protein